MSGAASDERLDRLFETFDALCAAQDVLRGGWEELRSRSQDVVARTEKIEKFVDELKADPVVCRAEHHHALGVVREDQAKTQVLAQELKARVDELAAFKVQVNSVVARVPDDRQSPWIQGLSLELEQCIQEDVKRRLDATLKEYHRDSSTTHQQKELDGVSARMDKIDDRMDEHLRRLNNFGMEFSTVRFELDAINNGLSEREAKLEGSPMPRMARGAARGGMRGIPPNRRPTETADVGVEGNASATGSARGSRGDRRLTFEEERAPDETPEGAEYSRGSGGRPSMFRFDQETEERAEEEQGAPSTPMRYYLTASQVLDPQFTCQSWTLWGLGIRDLEILGTGSWTLGGPRLE